MGSDKQSHPDYSSQSESGLASRRGAANGVSKNRGPNIKKDISFARERRGSVDKPARVPKEDS